MILAGDIGGTKTVLALYEGNPSVEQPIQQEVFPSREYRTFREMLERFLGDGPHRSIETACLGVAGPVIDGHVHTTNLPWVLHEGQLAEQLRANKVRLLNDVEAAAYGMTYLRHDEFHFLTHASVMPRKGHAVLLAAGTGLGQAMVYWDGQHYHPMASEGGHADFAPQSDQEVALFKYLRGKFGHVSYERLLSGPGFINIYSFLKDSGIAQEPLWLKEKMSAGDPAAVITSIALSGGDPLCEETLSLFVRIYGAAAGNLALHVMATGGVYIGGGIAPKILPKLQDGTFMEAFTSKGRYANLLKNICVCVALNPPAPLCGAANFAWKLYAPTTHHRAPGCDR